MGRTGILAGLILMTAAPGAGAHDEPAVLAMATRTLEDMAANPRTGVPVNLLRQAEGVILVPNLINAGFIVGAKVGRGVFLVRDSKGAWGNPIFIHVSGGSFGLQAGAQATELLMVFRSKETVTRLLAGKGKITLGVDVGVAAGPVGTGVGADTDLGMRAEILTYARSRGLFAGASLGGSGISVDRRNNAFYYGDHSATTFQIIEGEEVGVPLQAAKIKGILSLLTDPPPTAVEIEGRVIAEPRVSAEPKTRVRIGSNVEEEPEVLTPVRRRPASGPDEPDADDRSRPIRRGPASPGALPPLETPKTGPDSDPDSTTQGGGTPARSASRAPIVSTPRSVPR